MTSAAVLEALPLAGVSLRHRKERHGVSAWRLVARPEQLPPTGVWSTWYVQGGRGSGKTWTGANNLAEMAGQTTGTWGIVAPSFGEARDKCVEGESGILAALGTNRVEVARRASVAVSDYNRSLGEIYLRNGSLIVFDGADDGAPSIQGYNLHGCWADEVGLWKRWPMAWEESIGFAVRKDPARIIATGTPKRGHGLVRKLIDDALVRKTHMRTEDNAANLSPVRLAELKAKYDGTTLGRQELGGELIDDADGALWNRNLIAHSEPPREYIEGLLVPSMTRIVVGVDPAVTSKPDSDETGIVVAGLSRLLTPDGQSIAFILDDRSLQATPRAWASAAINAYRDHRADRIVPEVNNGGEMVELTIHTIDANVPVKPVHATQGKRTRAEPVQALYEKGRVIHAATLVELEDQMCNWDPKVDTDSPDRVDALVWALTELMITGSQGSTEASWIA